MPAETVPEILRTSLQAAVLHLKAMPLNVDVLHFDWMDAPQVMQAPVLLAAHPLHSMISSSSTSWQSVIWPQKPSAACAHLAFLP